MTEGWAVATGEPVAETAPATARCTICGHDGPAGGASPDRVSMGPIRWRDALPGRLFDAGHRCADHGACRARCEAIGDAWPVEDGTPATKPQAMPEPPVTDELDFGA